ncbi:MAG TPA: right-handed parallel beta-helix repeat-containing protein [Capillibacterium sp.]
MVKEKSGWHRSFLRVFFLYLLLGTFPLFIGDAVQAGSLPVITVSSPEEFIEAIGPDRIIRIETDVLLLPDQLLPIDSEYVTQEEVWDGYQLLIHDVANMTITGAGEKPVQILAQPRYAYILAFANVENVRIEGVEAGHTPGDDGCMAGVLSFQDCREIAIVRSILFGCGAEGVVLTNVDGLYFEDSVIRNCVYRIMIINQSQNCFFSYSTFIDNEGNYLIEIDNSQNICFSGCQIRNNNSYWSDYSSIFEVNQCEAVSVEDCLVEDNTAGWFIFHGTGLTVEGTPVENNLFYQGYCYSEIYKYDDYYDKLNYLELLRLEKTILQTDNRAEIRLLYTDMVNALLELAQNQDPVEPELEYLLGSYYVFALEEDLITERHLAEERFRNILDQDPLCTPAYIGLGDVYFQECISQSIHYLSEGDLGVVFTRKDPFEDEGFFMEKALEEYLKALWIEEEYGEEYALEAIAPIVHYRIIALYCFTGEISAAWEYANRLVALDAEKYGNCLDTVAELVQMEVIPQKIEILI